MGMMDAQALLADDLDISATATGKTTSNVIDLGDPKKGAGIPLKVNAKLTEAVTSTASATVQFTLITSAAENLGSPTTLWDSGAIAVASLVIGYDFDIPPLADGVLQYVAMEAQNAVAITATGALHASIVADKETAGRTNG